MAAESADDQQVATIVTQTRVRQAMEQEFASWQERMSRVVAGVPGFVSQEVIPANPPVQEDWVIVQRFETRAAAQGWLDSAARADMLEQIAGALEGDDAVSVVVGGVRTPQTAATAVIRTSVGPRATARFARWHAEITDAQRRWPGYVGSSLQAPISGVQEEWTTLVTFDSPGHLEAWMGSDERAALLERLEAMESRDLSTRTVESGFSNWFDLTVPDRATVPPWKFNYLILLGLYPIVMIEILFLNPLMEWTNVAIGNLIGNVLSVAFLGWPVVILLDRSMKWWTVPQPGTAKWTGILGVSVILVALTILVIAFYVIADHVSITPVTNL